MPSWTRSSRPAERWWTPPTCTPAGGSEEIIGRWLADRPQDVTDRVVLATKGRFPMADDPNGVGLSARHLTRALDASLQRLGVDADRPLPGARLRPAHPAGGDAPHVRRLHPDRQDPLLRPVELHRLAADEGGPAGQGAEPGGADHPAAAVQPAGPGDRMGDRAGRPGRRPRAAAVVTAGRRLALRQVPAQRTAHRQHPAGRGPGARHGGLRQAQRAADAPGTSSRPCSRSPTAAGSRWPRSRWPGSPTGRPSPRRSSAPGPWPSLTDNLGSAGLRLQVDEVDTLDAASRLPVGDYPYGELGVEQRQRPLAGGRG